MIFFSFNPNVTIWSDKANINTLDDNSEKANCTIMQAYTNNI